MRETENPSPNPKLTQGISYFEEVLQLMPNDRSALEFLAVAYEQLGNREKRSHAVARLTDVLIAEKDLDCLKNLKPTLDEIGTPEALNALRKIENVLGKTAVSSTGQPPRQVLQTELLAAIKAEMELLNYLQAKHLISDDTAKIVESSLYNHLSGEDSVLISALAFVKNENPAECESALAALADAFHLPPVPLQASLAAAQNLPSLPDNFIRRGARPFAELGDTLLVAILNPLDDELRKGITAAAGKPCQFFLADPSDMEAAPK